jgi:hypothetical protein
MSHPSHTGFLAWLNKLFSGGDVLAVVERVLQKRGWNYHRLGDHLILSGVRSMAGFYLITFGDERDKRTLVILFNELPRTLEALESAVRNSRHPLFRVHEDAGHTASQIAGVCERLLAENYRLVLGRFERDPKDGEIRYGIAIPYRDQKLSEDQVNWAIDVGTRTMDQVMPEIHRMAR